MSKRPRMIHREEEQCRQGRHTSPGVGKHEGKGAVLNRSTQCPHNRGAAWKEPTRSSRRRGVVLEEGDNPFRRSRRGAAGDTQRNT